MNSIGSVTSSQFRFQTGFENNKLSDDQKDALNKILADYDASTMNSENMGELMEKIKSSGIPPSKELKEIMDAAGFPPPQKPEGPPPEDMENSSVNNLPDFLLDFLEKQKTEGVNQEDIDLLIEKLTASGSFTNGQIIDQKVI